MNNERAFDIWAPAGGRWSDWAKPVLFACMPEDDPGSPSSLPPWDTGWLPATTENLALVLDLPGREGVAAALALAARGFRPVPLYNATPGPASRDFSPVGPQPIPAVAVDAKSIMTALQQATGLLGLVDLALDAPPAFMLDANRRGGNSDPAPRTFDNRSVSFATDFPSPALLRSHGIRGAILVQATGSQPQADLAPALRRWQEAGLVLKLKRLDHPGPPMEFEVACPPRFRRVWQWILEAIGWRRSPPGGFGHFGPFPGSNG